MATPATSRILAPLEDAVAGKESADPIDWTHSLSQRFREAKAHIKNTHTLYLPHPDDQLVIKTDAAQSSPGIGHTIYAIKEGKLHPVRFHSAKLKPGCKLWSPCELEALAVAIAIETEYPLLRESRNPVLLLPDNKPVQDAVALIQQGKFSASARMNRFLTNINKVPISIKHLSSKFHLNEVADHQSRNPSSCSAVNCSIHRFISGLSDTVVDAAAKCGAVRQESQEKLSLAAQTLSSQYFLDDSLTNRQAWRAAQSQSDSVKAAVSHLKSGKVPTVKGGDLNNEIRHYVRHGILEPDGLLVTEGDQSTYSPGEPKKKIIVPHHLAAGVLFHLHNNVKFSQHPSLSQLKATFNRYFYTWNLGPLLDQLYKNCYKCLVGQKQPRIVV